jgi:Spy/CpxP family protein refolding chaperone
MASPQVSAGAATQASSSPIENYFRNSGGVGVLLGHAQDFGLSEAQVDQLEALRPTFELARHDVQAALLKAETQLRAVLQNDTAAENDVMAAIDEVSRFQGELLKMRYRNMQKARNVLTADQRNKVKAFRRQQELASAEQRRQ